MHTRIEDQNGSCILASGQRFLYSGIGEVMTYKIAINHTDEGFSVSVPGLPGCWSQGTTEDEALDNIRIAITEYLSVRDDLLRGADIREVEVGV